MVCSPGRCLRCCHSWAGVGRCVCYLIVNWQPFSDSCHPISSGTSTGPVQIPPNGLQAKRPSYRRSMLTKPQNHAWESRAATGQTPGAQPPLCVARQPWLSAESSAAASIAHPHFLKAVNLHRRQLASFQSQRLWTRARY